jgi:hypothetical protein
MPVILATQEAEIRRISVQSQPGQIVHETLPQKTLPQNRAGGVAQGEGHEFKPQYCLKKKKKVTSYLAQAPTLPPSFLSFPFFFFFFNQLSVALYCSGNLISMKFYSTNTIKRKVLLVASLWLWLSISS